MAAQPTAPPQATKAAALPSATAPASANFTYEMLSSTPMCGCAGGACGGCGGDFFQLLASADMLVLPLLDHDARQSRDMNSRRDRRHPLLLLRSPGTQTTAAPPSTWLTGSCARSRSPSPMVQSMVCASPQDAAPVIESPKARTPPVHFWRRRRGFREAYASPLARLPPIVTHCVVRSGAPNPKYERVGDFLVLRYRTSR